MRIAKFSTFSPINLELHLHHELVSETRCTFAKVNSSYRVDVLASHKICLPSWLLCVSIYKNNIEHEFVYPSIFALIIIVALWSLRTILDYTLKSISRLIHGSVATPLGNLREWVPSLNSRDSGSRVVLLLTHTGHA